MTKSYYAGMEIDAPCGRCKMETKHRILSITDGVPEKLICAACSSVHKFKPEPIKSDSPASIKAPRPAKAAHAAQKRSTASPSNFQHLMTAERAGTIAKPYGQGINWEMGMWVDHPVFGLGKIQRRLGRKIDVLFQSGLKTLMAL